jgi:hypothetical protein
MRMADERERQTSNKAGLRSLGKKLDNSRYGFDEHPGSRKTAGAFGRERARGAEDESPDSDPSTSSGSPRGNSE